MSKPKKKKITFFRLSIICFAVYLSFSLVKLQADLAENQQALDEIKIANEQQRIANKELERILAQGSEDEYIEQVAKEKLNFAYPDEQVLIDVSGS